MIKSSFMRKGSLLLLAGVLALTAFTGCSGGKTDLPDVSDLEEFVVIAREEGSGTRSEFESLVDTTESAADSLAQSTEEVIEQVSSDVNAIGYVAYSSAIEAEGISILTVGGIEATTQTIQSGKYPLTRNYYLCYQDDLSDAATDFLRYIESAGQAIVSEYCVALDDASTFLSDQSEGTVSISGSSSMAPILEALAADYANYNSHVTIEVVTSDSATGLNEAILGEVDFGMSSRELESYEEELLNKTSIGRDGISVIVNAENPVENLTVGQIKKIYNGVWNSWSEIS